MSVQQMIEQQYLLDAIDQADVERVRSILEANPALANARDREGRTLVERVTRSVNLANLSVEPAERLGDDVMVQIAGVAGHVEMARMRAMRDNWQQIAEELQSAQARSVASGSSSSPPLPAFAPPAMRDLSQVEMERVLRSSPSPLVANDSALRAEVVERSLAAQTGMPQAGTIGTFLRQNKFTLISGAVLGGGAALLTGGGGVSAILGGIAGIVAGGIADGSQGLLGGLVQSIHSSDAPATPHPPPAPSQLAPQPSLPQTVPALSPPSLPRPIQQPNHQR